jgi:hypothetical protein
VASFEQEVPMIDVMQGRHVRENTDGVDQRATA